MKKRNVVLLGVIFLVFIGLGLPDALLGSSWNLVRDDLNVPLGFIGFTTATAFVFTILSTFFAPRLLARYQTKQVVLVSLFLTGSALIMMSLVKTYLLFVVFAIPLGMGAGAIDFSINHYVAIHYKAKHMNYLHSFYGLGVMIGPMVMAITLQNQVWRMGYIIIGGLLLLIMISTILSKNLWFSETSDHRQTYHKDIKIKDIIHTPGVKTSILIFLFYVHIESLFGVFIASYFYIIKGVSYAEAASFTLLYYSGLAGGRFLSGLVSPFLKANTLIYLGSLLMVFSSLTLLISFNHIIIYLVIVFLVGMGSGPIFPNMIHMNDKNFNKDKMSRVMSLQMTFAYISFGVLTPTMGFIFQWTSISIFPIVASILAIVLSLLIYKFMSFKLDQRLNIT